ncbi:MAG: DUF4082 domain-containing protein [Nocardioides sp.]
MNRVVAALSSMAIVAGVWVPAPAALGRQAEDSGLWSTGFAAKQTEKDCGKWPLDKNNFCVANDSLNGLEVGVKFQSSTQLAISGVRIYRVDPAQVRATLWDSAGTALARATLSAGSGEGWQDLIFDDPVTIAPATTYVASYFTPGTKYAFSYEYFADTALTVGPVTALPSTEADPNGVHCYDDAKCGSFPVHGYKSSSYWVTPLWLDPGDPPPADPRVDLEAPRVTAGAPAHGSQRVRVGPKVKVRFSEPVLRATLTRTTVRLLRDRNARAVNVRLRYDADRQRVVLTPRKVLRPATTYRVQVTTSVRDVAGNRLDQVPTKAGLQKATWTFRTR